jgi:hypothetical protein
MFSILFPETVLAALLLLFAVGLAFGFVLAVGVTLGVAVGTSLVGVAACALFPSLVLLGTIFSILFPRILEAGLLISSGSTPCKLYT